MNCTAIALGWASAAMLIHGSSWAAAKSVRIAAIQVEVGDPETRALLTEIKQLQAALAARPVVGVEANGARMGEALAAAPAGSNDTSRVLTAVDFESRAPLINELAQQNGALREQGRAAGARIAILEQRLTAGWARASLLSLSKLQTSPAAIDGGPRFAAVVRAAARSQTLRFESVRERDAGLQRAQALLTRCGQMIPGVEDQLLVDELTLASLDRATTASAPVAVMESRVPQE